MALSGNGNHIAGGKVSRSHTTVIDAARKVVVAADGMRVVSKIVLGMVTPNLGVGKQMIKFLPINGGVKAVVRGTNSKQEIFIYTSDVSATERELGKLFE